MRDGRDHGTVAGKIGRDELVARVRSGAIDTVITALPDMQGRLIGKRVTGSFFVEHALDHGTHFCTYLLATDMEMSTPDGFAEITWASGYGDYLARPDWSTLRVIPWLERTALVFCDAVDESTGAEVEIAPRRILQRQIARAATFGFVPRMAAELEFYVLNETYAEAHARGFAHLTPSSPYNEDYQLLQTSKTEPLHRRLRNEMTAAGIPIEGSKGEAAPGQHEINIHVDAALESADRAALFKHGAKEIADQEGRSLTFMAKPDQRWTGSSGHIHLSLANIEGGASAFATGPDAVEMSDTMRWFLGGLVAGARDLALFLASTINAYKRYATASWAPVHIVWGRDNRTCGFRVVGRGDGLRIENRLPGADANPHLAFAATLAAGLQGIDRQIEPPAMFAANAYTATGAPRMPRSLGAALDVWNGSELAREAFGADVHAHYATAARVEVEAFETAVTDWERARYFERG